MTFDLNLHQPRFKNILLNMTIRIATSRRRPLRPRYPLFIFVGSFLFVLHVCRLKRGLQTIAASSVDLSWTFETASLPSYIPEYDRFTPSNTSSSDLLGCEEISNLEIVREIGEGRQKRAFEVRLPNGRTAMAKRCKSYTCIKKKQVQKEAQVFQELLQTSNGQNERIRFYGACDGVLQNEHKQRPNRYATNFTVGYTSISELATPFFHLGSHDQLFTEGNRTEEMAFRACFAQHFTPRDKLDFVTIARQYARNKPHPYLMRSLHRKISDNFAAEQYALTAAGVAHIDVDMIYPCETCTTKQARRINCEIISRVVRQKMNCSRSESKEDPETLNGAHINVTKALAECRQIPMGQKAKKRRKKRTATS